LMVNQGKITGIQWSAISFQLRDEDN